MCVPYARVNTVKEGLFTRLPRAVNKSLDQRAQADIFHDSFYSFRALVYRMFLSCDMLVRVF